MFSYRLHGLDILSELELPMLFGSDCHSADVQIKFGPVEALPFDASSNFRNWTAVPGRMVITALGSARLGISDGRHIAIEVFDGALSDDLISFTLGSAMSALLQQRALLPLHASSVVTDKGALLIMGRSGAGKSTLTAQLATMGYPVLADDVTAIDIDTMGAPIALPGLPSMRLWADALQRLDAQADAQRAVREGLEKYYLPASPYCDQPKAICGIIRLTTKADGGVEIYNLERATAVSRISHHVHRKHFLPAMGLQRFAFERATMLVQHVPIVEIKRPYDGFLPDQMAASVIDRFQCASPARQS
jgi:energy-coupling factor transporter ATP-binding protein EcfA2